MTKPSPFTPDFHSEFRITELSKRKQKVSVESEDYLRPVISMQTERHSDNDNLSVLRISVYYNRTSALFQVMSIVV